MKNQLSLRWNRKPFYGLMSVVFLSLFMLSAVVFVGCDKETPVSVDEQSPSENLSDAIAQQESAQAIKFSYQGKLYTNEEFQKIFEGKEFPMMVAGDRVPEKNVVYVFDSKAAFEAWAKSTPFADRFAEMEKQISEARAKVESDPAIAESYSGILLGKGNPGSINVAGGSAKLYEHINFGGGSLPSVAAGYGYYNLTNVRFSNNVISNNKTSSVKVTTCAGWTDVYLFDGIGWTGSGKLLSFYSSRCPSTNSTTWKDLRQYNFNDKTSSFFVQ